MEKRFELFEIVIDALNEKNTLENLILIGGRRSQRLASWSWSPG